MTRPFIHEDFLLESEAARDLYHRFAQNQPIIDYHCHLSPEQIANDHQFANLTEIWLHGDHYKWRAMRANGVDEKYCTGSASAWEKFHAWAATVPATLRNPLYHWTHMELATPFGITDRLLDSRTACNVYEQCNELLRQGDFSAQGLLRKFNVLVVCTTDDPTDSLEHHERYARSGAKGPRLYPTWRPDKALGLDDPAAFNTWLDKLEGASGIGIRNFSSFIEALENRHEYFHQKGCRLSDHGLEGIYAENYTDNEVSAAFDRARAGKPPTKEETLKFKSAMLHRFGLMDHARGWAQQFHLGALRDVRSRMRRALGPDTGFDSIGDFELGHALGRFLDRLDGTNQLAKTILYNLNPRDNELMAAMIGNFQDGSAPGKMQYGGAWWFLDQLDGMEKQITALSNLGLLARFIGMVTDSRSFLSYSRHDYFRRLFCNILGRDLERGLLPDDRELLGNLVRDVCFHNAKNYFKLDTDANVEIGG